jgi:hypothetical protein
MVPTQKNPTQGSVVDVPGWVELVGCIDVVGFVAFGLNLVVVGWAVVDVVAVGTTVVVGAVVVVVGATIVVDDVVVVVSEVDASVVVRSGAGIAAAGVGKVVVALG